MKKLLIFMAVAILAYGYFQDQDYTFSGSPSVGETNRVIQDAHANRQSDIQVRGQGTVVKVLRDDLQGSRHQKFIVKLGSGMTLLVSHNIDLAPRVDGLREGDTVEFFGEYEWNDRGGVIHWTHHDPAGRHVDGWIEHKGRTYR